MKNIRIVAYSLSALAVTFFMLFPEPQLALIGALMLQTLAFITIAGKSLADGILLCCISVIIIGLLPEDHPLLYESEYYEAIRGPLLYSGIGLAIAMLVIIVYKEWKNVRKEKRVFSSHPSNSHT